MTAPDLDYTTPATAATAEGCYSYAVTGGGSFGMLDSPAGQPSGKQP